MVVVVVVPLRYPYVVSLLNFNTLSYLCGGVLVSRDYVVTAAQCTQGQPSILVLVNGRTSGVLVEV